MEQRVSNRCRGLHSEWWLSEVAVSAAICAKGQILLLQALP